MASGVNLHKIFLTDSRISKDGQVVICGQYSENEDQINLLMEKIKSQASNLDIAENLKTGDLCLALFTEDGQFYRGQIQADFGNIKTVEFIDYGNTQNTKTENLRFLSDDFRILDRQSHLFTLDANVEPVHSAGVWTPVVPAAILNEFLYAEIEIEESYKNQELIVKSQTIDKTLILKGIAKDSIMYPLNVFSKTTNFEAYVSHSSENGIIHVQPKKSENDLNRLMDKMAQFYKGDNLTNMRLPAESILVGTLVCSVYSGDGGFYRGQVRQIKSGDKCTVYHIDYGDSEETSFCNLYKLSEEFCELKYQALNCTLDNITLSKNISPAVIVDTINNFVQDKIFSVKVTDHHLTGTLVVNLEDLDTKKLLSDHLIDNKMAVSKSANAPEVEAITFDDGSKVAMILTHVEADGSFFCYSVSSEELLNEQLDSLYSYCTSTAAHLSSTTLGSLCCALFAVDGNWYRAKIIEKSSEKVTVRFIDYGNTEKCDVRSLLSMDPQFCKLPAQAVHCSLSANLDRHVLVNTLTELKDEELIVEFMNVKIAPFAVRLYHKGNVVGLTSQSPKRQGVSPTDKTSIQNTIAYKHCTVNLGGKKEVVLTNVNDLKSLWCVISDTRPELGVLMDEINEIYNSIIGDVYNFNPEDSDYGCPCVTFDTADKLWYRSKFLSSVGQNMYEVFYVDCGKTTTALKSNIKIISEDLLKLPAFAIRCTVSSIISASSISIPLEQCQNLLHEVENKFFVAAFNGYDREKDLYFAELHDPAGHLKTPKTLGNSNFPFLNIPMKTEVPVRITCIEDPDCIWVQLLDHQAELIVLTGRLNAYYNGLPQRALELDGGYSGQICCMKSAKTKNWCRGQIAYVYDNIIELKFIDFGYVEAANINDARVLMPEFFSLPTQAICCCLFNLKPSSSRWSNGSVRYIKEFVAKTGVSAIFSDRKSGAYSAALIVSTKDEKFLLSKRLVEEGLAAWIDVSIAEESMTNLNIKIDEPRTSPQKFMNPPQVFYTHPGISLIGAEVPVVVCEAALPSDFFVLPGNSDLKHTYEKLSRELKSYNKPELPSPSDLYVGMPCICIIGRDCLRAAIVSKEDLQNPTVFLVDFGEKKQVSMSSLKCITASHITCMPPVAIRCTLQGVVEPQNEFWSSKAVLHFSQFCKENRKDLVCTVHGCVSDSVSQFFMVKLNTPFRDITTELVDIANCKLVTPMGNIQPPFLLKSYIYMNMGFSIGREAHFYITHVERPDLFYCQLSSKFQEIDDFMDKVQEYCSNFIHRKPTTPKDLAFSPHCLARYEDGKWYRAHFISINPHSFNEVDVLFVDYGNLVTVSLTNIIQCEYGSGLAEMPILAVPCCLSEIVSPIVDTMESQRISNSMKQGLVHRQLLGIITGSTNGRIHLDLVDNHRRLNDHIIGNVSPVISLPDSGDRFSKDSTITGKFKDIGSIEPKTVHSVYISEVSDPDNFHIRLCQNDDQFNECTAEVDGFYTAVRRQDYSIESLESGNVICAKHPSTLRWCRALVLDCVSYGSNQVLVEFVDIGEKEVVSIEDNTKKIVTDMLSWPRMTLKCQLANVVPVSGSWDHDSVECFVRTCQYIKCRVRFNTPDVTRGVWNIDMKIEGKNIAHMLVEDGFATFVKVPSSTVSSNAESIKTKPLQSWTKGATKKVYISHVESIEEVYLQLVEFETSLNQLMDQLNNPSLNMKKVPGAQLSVDVSYAAKYEEDGQYYRANVLSYDVSKSHYHMIYTDYGNTAFVRLEDVFLLPKQFSTLPEQAVKCSIHLSRDVADSALATKKMEDLAVSSHTYFAECITMDSKSSSNIVDFWIMETSGNEKIKFCDFLKPKDQKYASKAVIPKLKTLDIPTAVERKVYVAQVDGPDKIWIQLSSNSQDLDGIMDKIESYCNSRLSKSKLPAYDVGTPCIAKYSADNGWYRGMIKDKKDSENFATVHFVDYGNAESVKVEDLLTIDDQFVDLPMQAVFCQLHDVDGVEKWTSNDTDDFVSRVSDVELTATFRNLSVSNQSCVRKDLNIPCYVVELIYPCGKSLNNEWNETLANRSEHLNLDGGGDTSPSTTVASRIGTTEKHIVTDRGDHVIVENLLVQTASLDFDTSIDVRTPLANTEKSLNIPSVEPKSHEAGYISHCESPLQFYIQLTRLAAELDQIYEKARDHANKNPVLPFNEGYYVALSPDDAEWYRVKCLNISTNQCKVSFIDYGNSAVVKPDVIRPISDELKSFPMQSIQCKLYDFEPNETSESITDFFLDLTLEKDLVIDFVNLTKLNIWEVKLSLDGEDVCQSVKTELNKKLQVVEKQTPSPSILTVKELQIEAGCCFCVKVFDFDSNGNFSAIKLNVSRDFTEQVNAEQKSYEEGTIQHVNFGDLKPAKVYLCKYDSEWIYVRAIKADKVCVKVVNIKTAEILEQEAHDALFIEPPTNAKTMIEHIFVDCTLHDTSKVNCEKLTNAVCDEKVVIEIINFDKLNARWIVKLHLIETDTAKHKSQSHSKTAHSQLLPSICVSDTGGQNILNQRTDAEGVTSSWVHEHLHDLIEFFNLGAECLKDCPGLLAPLHVALMRSKHIIMPHLSDDQKLKLEGRLPEDRLKRFSGDLTKTGREILPPKKLKLDLDENDFENGQCGNEMFIAGDQFEAIISNIESPGLFYVRPFLVMSEPVVNAEYPPPKDIKRIRKIDIGSFCIAKCINMSSRVHHWVRAVVEQRDGENFNLKDIDTGARFLGTINDIYPVGKNIEVWPSFCLQSSIAGIKPFGNKYSGWPDLAVKEFESLLGNIGLSDSVEVHIITVSINSNTGINCFGVDVSINGVSVADTLVSLKVAEKMFDLEKENAVEVSLTEGTSLFRGAVRKPFTDLMPNIVITRSSASDGESLPDFDLLAVPWKVIRTSIGDARPESLSDSVFVSDIDDSFATTSTDQYAENPRQLTTFKIYSSTVSSESSDGDTTLAAESIENALEGDGVPPLLSRIEINLNEHSLSSSLLDILTPVTATSSECFLDKSEVINTPGHPQYVLNEDMKLDQVAKKIVEEVFISIEKEEMDEEDYKECIVPDSLDNLTQDASQFNSEEKSLLSNLALQPVENLDITAENSIVLPDSLYDETPVINRHLKRSDKIAVFDTEQQEEEVIHAMENLHLDEIAVTKEVLISNKGEEYKPETVLPDAKNVAVTNQENDISSKTEILHDFPTPELAKNLCDDTSNGKATVISNLHQDDIVTESDEKSDKTAFEVENVIVADYQEVNTSTVELCEIPTPEDLIKVTNLPEDELDSDKGPVNVIELKEGLDDKELTDNVEENIIPKTKLKDDQLQNADDSLTLPEPSQEVVDRDDNNNRENFEKTINNHTEISPRESSEVENGINVDECLVEIPVPTESLTESPFTDIIKDQDLDEVTKFKPQCDPYVMDSSQNNEVKDDKSNSAECSKPLQEPSTIKLLNDNSAIVKCDGIDNLEKKDVFEKLTAIPHEEAKAFSMDALERELNQEAGDSEIVVNVFDDANDTILAKQEDKDLKEFVELCSQHSHQKYICCLPKMQLEVGDTYSVTYMNSEDPHNIRLQFDMTADSEEWLDALRGVNNTEGVKSLNVQEKWEIDMMCLVQSPVDSSWERGRILKVEDAACTVELFDYGDILTTTLNRLCEIPDSLCLFPRQTVHCSLGDAYQAKTQDEKWDSSVSQYIYDLLFCSSLKAEILEVHGGEVEESYVVRLVLLEEGKTEQNVGKMLVDAGFAQITKEEDVEKKGDDEWSTMTDSAWETLLNADVGSPDKMHSSNVDLSIIEDPFKEDQSIPISMDTNLSRKSPPEKELVAVAHEVQTRVIANALIIAEIKDEKTSSKKRRKSTDLYIDLEKIPQILIEAYESTEID